MHRKHIKRILISGKQVKENPLQYKDDSRRYRDGNHGGKKIGFDQVCRGQRQVIADDHEQQRVEPKRFSHSEINQKSCEQTEEKRCPFILEQRNRNGCGNQKHRSCTENGGNQPGGFLNHKDDQKFNCIGKIPNPFKAFHIT